VPRYLVPNGYVMMLVNDFIEIPRKVRVRVYGKSTKQYFITIPNWVGDRLISKDANAILEVGIAYKSDEFQSFVVKPYVSGSCYLVNIPTSIARALGIRKGSLIRVIMRRVSREYAKSEYGYVPKSKFKVKHPKGQVVRCPVCGEIGILKIDRKRNEIWVRHPSYLTGKCLRAHYVPKSKFGDFYDKMKVPHTLKFKKHKKPLKRVICPVCGREGLLILKVSRTAKCAYVYHEDTWHYVSKTKYRSFYKEHAPQLIKPFRRVSRISIVCPVCGKVGNVIIRNRYGKYHELYVGHGYGDYIRHYISPHKYPKIYKDLRELMMKIIEWEKKKFDF